MIRKGKKNDKAYNNQQNDETNIDNGHHNIHQHGNETHDHLDKYPYDENIYNNVNKQYCVHILLLNEIKNYIRIVFLIR